MNVRMYVCTAKPKHIARQLFTGSRSGMYMAVVSLSFGFGLVFLFFFSWKKKIKQKRKGIQRLISGTLVTHSTLPYVRHVFGVLEKVHPTATTITTTTVTITTVDVFKRICAKSNQIRIVAFSNLSALGRGSETTERFGPRCRRGLDGL